MGSFEASEEDWETMSNAGDWDEEEWKEWDNDMDYWGDVGRWDDEDHHDLDRWTEEEWATWSYNEYLEYH